MNEILHLHQYPLILLIVTIILSAVSCCFYLYRKKAIHNITLTSRESNDNLHAIMDSMVDGIAMINKRGEIVSFNPSAEQIFGYSQDEVIGRNVNMLMPEPWHSQHDQYLNNYLQTGEKKIIGVGREVEGRRKDGQTFALDLGVSETYLTGQRLFVGILRDLSEKNAMQAALLKSNEELQSFAYVSSHDLQEPLRMVTSYLQLIERRYNDKLDDDGREFIRYAVDGSARMQTLIQSLLTYSRVGTHGKEFFAVDTKVILQKALSNLEIAIKESNTQIECDDTMPVINGDESQIIQLFQNLIGNAIKFIDDATPLIHIRVEKLNNFHDLELSLKLESGWLFSVEDNGIGISEEYWQRIFKIFQRLHGPTEYKGTGIGLSICKKIVERHGGRIWLKSKPGKGTTFYFIMPAAPATTS